MEQHAFGYWLKLKRKSIDLTREELAKRVGYSAATIRKIEDEERHPSVQVVERLAEIFNIPPNERTDFLRFARGDSTSAPHEIIGEMPWRASTISTRSNLPATVTSLVGREKETENIREYLLKENIRLVNLIGPPGIGKTRLSIESARTVLPDFPDGVFFVVLAPLDDPSRIIPAIVQALDYVEVANVPAGKQLADGIGDKQMLILLDNCEHLIEKVASLASDLLSACSRLKILVTSRESLRIPGEWVYSVPALPIPKEISAIDMETVSKFPALTLFAERALAVRSDFALDASNIQIVASICMQLDGLPLAIELIAARIRLMSPQALLQRLNDQFILSANGMRAYSLRQKTLQDAIGWSYNLLSTEEQKLFAYLSIFAGGFTLEAVESIFSRNFTGKSVPDLIGSLLDKSLIQRTSNELGEIRYDMLVTIQQFASNCLHQMSEESDVRNIHLAYFLDLAEQGDKEMRGHNQVEWLKRLNGMRDNLRAALEWAIKSGQAETAMQMARKLHWFWFVRSDHNEGRRWLERVLALPDVSLYPQSYAEALTQLVHHTWVMPHHSGPQSRENDVPHPIMQALVIARANNDKRNIARAQAMLGLFWADKKDFVSAKTILEEGKALFQEVHDEWGYAHAILCLGFAAYSQDDQPTSLILNKQALAIFRKTGDRYFMSVCLRYIGDLHMKQDNLTHGEAALRESLILVRQLDSKYEIAAVIWRLGKVAQHSGNPARAICLYWATKKLFDSIGAWTEKDESEFENTMASCRAALDELAFATAVEQGRAMTMEQAIAYALGNDL